MSDPVDLGRLFRQSADFFPQPLRFQNLDIAAFAENPADRSRFRRRRQDHDQGAVLLRRDDELFRAALLVQVIGDLRSAFDGDVFDLRIIEEPLPAGLLRYLKKLKKIPHYLIGTKNHKTATRSLYFSIGTQNSRNGETFLYEYKNPFQA